MEDIDEIPPNRLAVWGRRLAIFLGVLVVLLIVAYFVGTSSAFVKAVILPRAGKALNAKITAGEISVSPFSQLHAKQLRVETTGPEPLLTAEEVRVRYRLRDILKGNIKVDELTVVSPVVNLVQESDGTSNLDPLTQGESKPKPAKTEPTKLSIQNVSIKNGTVRQVEKNKNGDVSRTELQGLSLDLDHLGNGQTGKLNLASRFSVERQEGRTNNVLGGEVSGGYEISLNQELMPEVLKGSVKLTLNRTEGSFKDLSGLNGSLDADLTPKEIRQVALRFTRNGQPLGQVRLSGPMDVERKEGNLKLEIVSIEKNILALAMAGSAYDLSDTALNATNQVAISQGGTFFSANGNVAGTRVSLAQGAMKTPEMNLNVDYQVAVNTSEKSATLQRLNLTGQYGGKEFLRTQLDRQMNLSWGQTVKGYKDAALQVAITNFNVADWKAVLGTNLTTGMANANVSVVSQQDGKFLNAEMKATVNGLSAQFGGNRLDNAAVTIEGSGAVEQMKIVNLPRFNVTLAQNDGPVLQANGSARYVLEGKETTAQLTAEGPLPRLMALAAVPNASAKAGNLRASVQYNDAGQKRRAVGNFALADFSGGYQAYAFTNFSVGAEVNLEMDSTEAVINRAAVSLSQGFNKGGSIDVKGRYNLEKKTGQFSFSSVDLNQNTFGPFLAPSLGENTLQSISLNASGDAKLDPQSESSLKADVKIANWVVQDKAGKLPKDPLAVEMKVDGGMKKEVLDLRNFLVQLSPTPRAQNALQLQAKLDLSKTNPAPSTLTLVSESFDVTPYFDMFAGKTTTNTVAENAPAPAAAGQAPAAPGEQKEPEPMQLPFQQLTADLKIDRLYLRELAISNWVGKVSIRSNVVQLNPFQLALNGAPVNVNGNVNVGLPGYQYDLAIKADKVPLAPLANTFSAANSNKLEGNLVADMRIRGAGMTGPNLKKNLAGNAHVNLTNLNYQVVGPKIRRILVPISIALRVPELAETPINWVALQSEIANGVVDLKYLRVESEAFYAESAGPITLADVLTNTPYSLPLDLSLRRSLAQKSGLLAPNTPEDAKYAKLPRFVTLKGTIGAPESPDINKVVVMGMAARGAAAFGLGNEKTEKALGAVGNILTGQRGGTDGASTNTPSAAEIVQGLLGAKEQNTNNPVKPAEDKRGNLIRGLGGLLGGQGGATATNAANVKTNAAPTNAIGNAIDSLLRSRKK